MLNRDVRADFDIGAVTRCMADAITHRGPDDGGTWLCKERGIALGHRRLSVIDVSNAGHQPMMSANGRLVLAFNGEIYNHQALRVEINKASDEPVRWRGHSDTETLLEALSCWGLKETLSRVCGMFAFALWDRKRKILYLARDRAGEKPLYYGWQKDFFLFASELKPLTKHPHFEANIDRNSLRSYFTYNYIPSPFSIFHNINKLPAGSYLAITQSDLVARCLPEPYQYWSAEQEFAQLASDRRDVEFESSVDGLHEALSNAVKRQMYSDVPLGMFLSGGIDSTTIAAVMQENANSPINTFTIGFDDKAYNEAIYAKKIAAALGTHHHELYVGPAQALDVIPDLPYIYDEPFADSSQIPTSLVSKLTRAHVTVALSGDGGDELFGGYVRHYSGIPLYKKFMMLPMPLRGALSKILLSMSPGSLESGYSILSRLLPSEIRYSTVSDKIQKVAYMLRASSLEDAYMSIISHWKNLDSLVVDDGSPVDKRVANIRYNQSLRAEEYVMMRDFIGYLADDILVKVDRASMAASLEVRAPFLDLEVIRFAWSTPLHHKINRGAGKLLLKQLLTRYLPQELMNRPKMGFALPLSSWLKGALRDWSESLLDPSNVRQQGYLNCDTVSAVWKQHCMGERENSSQLWSILMFQAWLDSQGLA